MGLRDIESLLYASTLLGILISMATERTLIPRIRKRHLQFLGHIMRKAVSENLTFKRPIESKKDRGRPRFTDELV